MGSELTAHEAEGQRPETAKPNGLLTQGAIRADGIIVLGKSN